MIKKVNWNIFSLGCFFFLLLSNSVSAEDLFVTYKNNKCSATIDGKTYTCSIGKNGITDNKVEGDSCTPSGTYPLREILYREDKIDSAMIKTNLLKQKLTPNDGWCDEPKSKQYNKLVKLNAFDTSIRHEKMYRDDNLYDFVLVVGYNDNPPIPGKGSAIFIHVAREGYAGTAGCIGFSKEDLLEIVSKLDKKSKVVILK